jgi:hypothetical protein
MKRARATFGQENTTRETLSSVVRVVTPMPRQCRGVSVSFVDPELLPSAPPGTARTDELGGLDKGIELRWTLWRKIEWQDRDCAGKAAKGDFRIKASPPKTQDGSISERDLTPVHTVSGPIQTCFSMLCSPSFLRFAPFTPLCA